MNDMQRNELGRAAATAKRIHSDIGVMLRVAEANPHAVAPGTVDALRRAAEAQYPVANELGDRVRAEAGK